VLLYIIENMNQNYSGIPCFVEKKSKTTIKIYGISSTEFVVFYYKYLQLLSLFPQNFVSKNILFFPKPLLLSSPKSPHHDSKPTKNQNSN
jgi:hypothetical protein